MIGMLLAPLRGVLYVAQLIHDKVQEEMETEEVVRRRLVQLRLALEMEEMDAGEYAEREAELLARLREIRRARLAELGGNPHGGAGPGR